MWSLVQRLSTFEHVLRNSIPYKIFSLRQESEPQFPCHVNMPSTTITMQSTSSALQMGSVLESLSPSTPNSWRSPRRRYRALIQMLQTLLRMDKMHALHHRFSEMGMLSGTTSLTWQKSVLMTRSSLAQIQRLKLLLAASTMKTMMEVLYPEIHLVQCLTSNLQLSLVCSFRYT